MLSPLAIAWLCLVDHNGSADDVFDAETVCRHCQIGAPATVSAPATHTVQGVVYHTPPDIFGGLAAQYSVEIFGSYTLYLSPKNSSSTSSAFMTRSLSLPVRVVSLGMAISA